MSERKSPTQSATLYKVGTKKKGNDKEGKIFGKIKNKSFLLTFANIQGLIVNYL
jgi:hypothetical protein